MPFSVSEKFFNKDIEKLYSQQNNCSNGALYKLTIHHVVFGCHFLRHSHPSVRRRKDSLKCDHLLEHANFQRYSFKMLSGNETVVASEDDNAETRLESNEKTKTRKTSTFTTSGFKQDNVFWWPLLLCQRLNSSSVIRSFYLVCLHGHKHTVSHRFHLESICLAKLTVTSARDSNLDCSLPEGDGQHISA